MREWASADTVAGWSLALLKRPSSILLQQLGLGQKGEALIASQVYINDFPGVRCFTSSEMAASSVFLSKICPSRFTPFILVSIPKAWHCWPPEMLHSVHAIRAGFFGS